jgi:hypothetical protein
LGWGSSALGSSNGIYNHRFRRCINTAVIGVQEGERVATVDGWGDDVGAGQIREAAGNMDLDISGATLGVQDLEFLDEAVV